MTLKQRYLESKENAWSPTTYKGERARLNQIPDEFIPENPKGFLAYCHAQGYKPYTIKTLFIRASQLASYGGSATYANYTRDNANEFKRLVYTPRKPGMSFAEAVERIKANLSEEMAKQAFALLASGLRISEANCVVDGRVIGKGGRERAVINAPKVTINATKLRRALAGIGLTPHSLRKLAATRAVELGAREADLLAIFGWTSYQTASYYVQAVNVADVAAKLQIEVNL